MDLSSTIEARSDQMNADDLLSGPRTYTIDRVTAGNDDQPVQVHLVETPGRPWKPSKSMRRVLVAAWGPEADAYAGRRVTLYRNPEIAFGGQKVGGIEASHLSHLDKPMNLALTVTRGKKRAVKVQPLSAQEAQAAPRAIEVPVLPSVEAYRDYYSRRQQEGASPQELTEIRSAAENITTEEPANA